MSIALETIRVLEGDALEVLASIPDGTYSAVVTDPPYGLSKRPNPVEVLRQWLLTGDFLHKKRKGSKVQPGFMGQEWDSFVPGPRLWAEVYRVCRPGAIALVFASTRTAHWTELALELAGFEIIDIIAWATAQGMNKAGAVDKSGESEWSGWSPQLAPGLEPIIVARRPCAGTVLENLQEHKCGAFHVDACRIPIDPADREVIDKRSGAGFSERVFGFAGREEGERFKSHPGGRQPKNLLLSEEAAAILDEQVGVRKSGSRKAGARKGMGYHGANGDGGPAIEGSVGGASRFFWVGPSATPEDIALAFKYVPKVISAVDRNEGLPDDIECTHKTVKPKALMQWLCRLVGHPEGRILDPFVGRGTTLMAARAEGFSADGIERDIEFAELARLANGLPATATSDLIRLRNNIAAVIDATGEDPSEGPTVKDIGEWPEETRRAVHEWAESRVGDLPSALERWSHVLKAA